MAKFLSRTHRPIGIPQELSCQKDKICLSASDDVIGLFGGRDHSNRSCCYCCLFTYRGGERRLIPGAHWDYGLGDVAAGTHINEIDSLFLQERSKSKALLNRPTMGTGVVLLIELQPVGCRDANDQRIRRWQLCPHTSDNFQKKADSVFEASPILVLTLIAQR